MRDTAQHHALAPLSAAAQRASRESGGQLSPQLADSPRQLAQRHLIGRTLGSMVQQRQGPVPAATQLAEVGVNDDVGLEGEADAMGRRAVLTEGTLDKAQDFTRISSHTPMQRLHNAADALQTRPAFAAGLAPVVQRTTVADVQNWQLNEWTPTFGLMNRAITDLNMPAAFNFNDNDALRQKMASVSAQLAGHAYEFHYGTTKIQQRLQPQGLFAAWMNHPRAMAPGQHAQFGGGADVMATRRQAAGGTKTVQIKGVSSTEHYQVTNQLREAAEQLTGTHGEVPAAGAQRVARIVIVNPNNPYPFTTASGQTISANTIATVLHQFDLRTRNTSMHWNYVDKIKIVFAAPQTTADNVVVNSLELARTNPANNKVAGGLNSFGPGAGAPPASTPNKPANQFTMFND